MTLRTWALDRARTYMRLRPPDFVIGSDGDRYLERWIVGPWGRYERGSTPRNAWEGFKRKLPNLYLHRILRDDDDRALHDHPWTSVSWLLEGGYWEVLFDPYPPADREFYAELGEEYPTVKIWRPEGAVRFRGAGEAHRLVLDKRAGRLGRTDDVPVTSAFFTGFRVREWGFWCKRGWIPWQQFVARDDRGAIGKGCGE